MQSRRWLTWVLVGAVCCSLASTGCKSRKGKTGAGMADENIAGVTGGMYGEEGRPGRPEGDLALTGGQFSPVYFDYDSAQIKESERVKIETVADALKRSSSGGVIIEGNCDERGSNEYNLALGERRALAIRAYLTNLGVDGARIQTKSNGEENPVATGHDESSWSQNRRGEFVLFQ